jgi:RNA polymerase sigma-70 factor (ECF subfamily)
MSSSEGSIARDEWLEHAHALRKLAASLVSDEHEAQDLVQETWLRANDATHGNAPRSHAPWLRTVLRNLARDRSRDRARRAWSERNVAREEALPSASEVAERLDVAQRVAVEVARLDEPYRTVIHLRYFEGLSPEDIARRSHEPLETVRTRLRRGLAQLRERMDRAYGGERDAWSVALGAIAGRTKPALETSTAASMAAIGGVIVSTKVALSAAALVIAAASLFVWQRSSGEASLAKPSPPIERTNDSELARPKAPALEETNGEPAANVRVAAAAPISAPAADDTRIEVNGTVVITDEKGIERKDESGELGIATGTSEANAKMVTLSFEHGRWSTRVPNEQWIAFVSLTANRREAVLPRPAPIMPGAAPIVVRGEWTKRGRLRVIDAVTKQDLSDIEVRCSAQGWRGNEWTHPGDDERIQTVIDHATSPFDLPESTRYVPYWVHAPRHAWARIDFDHKTGGQRTLELSPTPSSAVVAVEGDMPKDAMVRLYPTGESRLDAASGIRFKLPEPDRMSSSLAVVSAHASANGPTRVDDLQPGKYLATVEVGEYEKKLRIGSAPIDVTASETVQVTVPIDASLLAVPRTHLFGTIAVPEGADLGMCVLRLTRADGGEKPFELRLNAMSHASGKASVLNWDAGPMRTGDYVATFTTIQHREIIHAPGPGDTKLALAIPALSKATVEVVDAETGATVEPERLQWTIGRVEGQKDSVSAPVMRNPRSRRFELVAPHGEVEISAGAVGYEEVSKKITLTSDTELCRLELKRATGIHLIAYEDEAPIEGGFMFFSGVRIRRPDGTTVSPRLGRSGGSDKTWYVDEPGRYEIVFPEHPSYEHLEPRTVEVATGAITEVIVQMKRRH